MTTRLVVLSEFSYAGHCTLGKSNKDWAACLAVKEEEAQARGVNEAKTVLYLSVHGPHGGNLIAETPKELPLGQAITHYQKKRREKEGKGYQGVPFAPFLPAFGTPLGFPLVLPETDSSGGKGETVPSPLPASGAEADPPFPYRASVVKAASLEKLLPLLAGGNYGMSEKVNGERCLLVWDTTTLSASNRRGIRMSTPPEGARHLCQLGVSFVLDGERLTGDLAGTFVPFDVLEWNGESLLSRPYMQRIMTLHTAMYQAGLLHRSCATPTFAEAQENSTVSQLALLVAVPGTDVAQQVMEAVQEAGGEGMIVRRLEKGSYHEESPLKYKFLADLDAFVIGRNEGSAAGSLKFGVIRTSDGAIIEVANVRSGFTDEDIRQVGTMVEQGKRPVFTITYLPARTVGLQLVEPRSGMACLRQDKEASECSTEQFEASKTSLVVQAQPVPPRF